KVAVTTISHGGDRIHETEIAITKEQLDPKNYVEKVFLSIGANDIRNLFSRDVGHLRAPLRRLVKSIRDLFGVQCKIYFQSLLPFEAQNRWTVRNVLAFNALLRGCCYDLKCYYINVFSLFVDHKGNRDCSLFRDAVHPLDRYLGRIARRYIEIIHPRAQGFNPEMY
ncbi:MAG: hypothetical protein GY820_27875, partial [Gammaproteobacteria bacterium]|nr:hypothetical protein [Gammaproteobacteria bacterium]